MERFGENVSMIISTNHLYATNETILHLISNGTTVNLDVFRAFMKHKVGGNMDS